MAGNPKKSANPSKPAASRNSKAKPGNSTKPVKTRKPTQPTPPPEPPAGKGYRIRTRLIHGVSKSPKWDYTHHVVPPMSSSATFRLSSSPIEPINAHKKRTAKCIAVLDSPTYFRSAI